MGVVVVVGGLIKVGRGCHLGDAEAHVSRPDHNFHLEGVALRNEMRHGTGNGMSGTGGIISCSHPTTSGSAGSCTGFCLRCRTRHPHGRCLKIANEAAAA